MNVHLCEVEVSHYTFFILLMLFGVNLLYTACLNLKILKLVLTVCVIFLSSPRAVIMGHHLKNQNICKFVDGTTVFGLAGVNKPTHKDEIQKLAMRCSDDSEHFQNNVSYTRFLTEQC